jgi:hypothetical protein
MMSDWIRGVICSGSSLVSQSSMRPKLGMPQKLPACDREEEDSTVVEEDVDGESR